MKFGVHYSLFTMNPSFLNNHRKYWEDISIPELMDVVNQARPDLLLGSYTLARSPKEWNWEKFLCWLYSQSPVKNEIVVSREFSCETEGNTSLSWRPNYALEEDEAVPNSAGLWATVVDLLPASGVYRRDAYSTDYLTGQELIHRIIHIVSSGGTAMIAVSPRSDGMIDPIAELRLRQVGQWLAVNEEAIFDTEPLMTHQSDTIRYTSRKAATGIIVYAIILQWPAEDRLFFNITSNDKDFLVTLVGWPEDLEWKKVNGAIEVTLPTFTPNTLPCQWAWVLKFEDSHQKFKPVFNRTTRRPRIHHTTTAKPIVQDETFKPYRQNPPSITTEEPSLTAKPSITSTEPSITTAITRVQEAEVTTKPSLNKAVSSNGVAKLDENEEEDDDEVEGKMDSIATLDLSHHDVDNSTERQSSSKEKTPVEDLKSNKTKYQDDSDKASNTGDKVESPLTTASSKEVKATKDEEETTKTETAPEKKEKVSDKDGESKKNSTQKHKMLYEMKDSDSTNASNIDSKTLIDVPETLTSSPKTSTDKSERVEEGSKLDKGRKIVEKGTKAPLENGPKVNFEEKSASMKAITPTNDAASKNATLSVEEEDEEEDDEDTKTLAVDSISNSTKASTDDSETSTAVFKASTDKAEKADSGEDTKKKSEVVEDVAKPPPADSISNSTRAKASTDDSETSIDKNEKADSGEGEKDAKKNSEVVEDVAKPPHADSISNSTKLKASDDSKTSTDKTEKVGEDSGIRKIEKNMGKGGKTQLENETKVDSGESPVSKEKPTAPVNESKNSASKNNTLMSLDEEDEEEDDEDDEDTNKKSEVVKPLPADSISNSTKSKATTDNSETITDNATKDKHNTSKTLTEKNKKVDSGDSASKKKIPAAPPNENAKKNDTLMSMDDDDEEENDEDDEVDSKKISGDLENIPKPLTGDSTKSPYNIPDTTVEPSTEMHLETSTLPTTTAESSNESHQLYSLSTPDLCQFWYGRIYCCGAENIPRNFDTLFCKSSVKSPTQDTLKKSKSKSSIKEEKTE